MGEAARSGRHPALPSAVLSLPSARSWAGQAARARTVARPGLCPAVPSAVSPRQGLAQRHRGLAHRHRASAGGQCRTLQHAWGRDESRSSTSPGKLQGGLPTALSWCSVYLLPLLPFSSTKNHFIVQTSVTGRKRQSSVHAKPRTRCFNGR